MPYYRRDRANESRKGKGFVVPPSRADVSDGSEGFAVSEPCGRWLWLGRAKAVRTYRTGAKALPCQSRAEDGYGWVAPKLCGRWLWLGRARAVRTMAMARSRQSRADVGYGWVAPKQCGRNETKAEALPCQSRADNCYGWVVPKPCTNERTCQEAEAKIGVILALRI